MVVELYIYIDGIARRIETFEDEKISITSSIQNINDISKVFTDYSQSFTIPASNNNNEIFSHWYENAIDNGFDQRRTYDGFIKIDTQTFRTGRWQLEGASVKSNRIENYKLTFFGKLKSLNDKLKDDKLSNLETLNNYSFVYNTGTIRDKIQNINFGDLSFPLISSKRAWQYGGGGVEDISQTASAINVNELFPAIRVSKVFKAIEDFYGITFNGSFLNTQNFTKAFLFLKPGNATELTPFTAKTPINFNSDYSNDYFEIINSTNEIIAKKFSSPTVQNANIRLTINLSSFVQYQLLVYKDNKLFTTLTASGNTINFNLNSNLGVGSYKFYLKVPFQLNYSHNVVYNRMEFGTTWVNTNTTINTLPSTATLSVLDLTVLAPNMKIIDFISGILKMFNLTAYSEDGINFTIEQLEKWYYQGRITEDWGKYCISDFDFSRVKPYKKINFEYEKSESLLNRQFFTLNNREFGNLSYELNNDGSDYTIKLPFENIMFNKFTTTNLQVGYCINSSLSPYEPKPIVLYQYNRSSVGSIGFKLKLSSTVTDTITLYNVFGQEMINTLGGGSSLFTLNWGIEISSLGLPNVTNTLFLNYYLPYLQNLYELKSRMVKVKMRLPYLEILSLRLNDRIVIRNKRYIINQYTTDLQTFETDFELLQDFRSINFNNSRVEQVTRDEQELIFETTSSSPLTWVIQSDPEGLVEEIKNEIDYVQVNLYANTTGLPQQVVIESNLNDVIIIEIDA